MTTRPIIDLPKTTTERRLDIASWLFVALSFAIVLGCYSDLPETIPTHFDGAGNVDGYGSKYTVFLLPVLSFAIVAGLVFLTRIPHRFNYLTTITPENAAFEYGKARLLLRIMNLFISLLLLAITWDIVQAALGKTTMGPWMWLFICPVLASPIFVTIVLSQMKQKS